jgi:hypothetical protein
MAVIDEILSGYEALRPGQEASYQDLHRHPELSHQEHRTARRVGDLRHGDGFAVTSRIGGTGMTGEGAQDMVDDGLFKRIPSPTSRWPGSRPDPTGGLPCGPASIR